MKNEKKVLALLAGIFLMVSALPSCFTVLRNLVTVLSYRNFQSIAVNFLNLGVQTLLVLTGLFLLLRKTKVAAVMQTVCAGLMVVYLVFYAINVLRNGYIRPIYIAVYALSVLAAILFAIALYLRGGAALGLAIAALSVRLIGFVLNLVLGHSLALLAVLNYLATLLYLAALLLAGLYLLSCRKASPAPVCAPNPGYGYPPQGYVYRQPSQSYPQQGYGYPPQQPQGYAYPPRQPAQPQQAPRQPQQPYQGKH